MSDTQRSETAMLMLGFDASRNTNQGYLFVAADILPKAKPYNISEDEARAALEGLAAKGLIRTIDDPSGWTEATVTVSGFRRYADRFMPEYPETRRAIVGKILEGKTAGDQIARALGQTPKMVDWALEDLSAAGYLELSRSPGQPSTVSRVYPSLQEVMTA